MVDKVHVITSVERRRRYGVEERLRIVAETFEPGARIADVARRHGMSRSLIQNWRKRLRDGTLPGADAGGVAETSAICRAQTKSAVERVFARATAQMPPATAPAPAGSATWARLRFDAGVCLEIEAGADPLWVAKILSGTRGCQ